MVTPFWPQVRVLGIRFIFGFPKVSKILIFDTDGRTALQEQFPWISKSEVLDVRKKTFYLSAIIALVGEPLFWQGSFYSAYKVAFIRQVKPKLVLTLNDNHEFFYKVSFFCKGVVTAFIQNSRRTDLNDIFATLARHPAYRVDYMFVHNLCIGNQYSRYIQGSIVPIGSFKNNLYLPVQDKDIQQDKSILFVSQWRSPKHFPIPAKDGTPVTHNKFYRLDQLLFNVVRRWCNINGVRLSVLLVNRINSPALNSEISFYRELLGSNDECSLLACETRQDAYSQLDAHSLTVTISSTMGLESLARGNRAAYFDLRKDCLKTTSDFGWPSNLSDTGPFWTSSIDDKSIFDLLEFCISSEQEAWEAAIYQAKEILMPYDPSNAIVSQILNIYR